MEVETLIGEMKKVKEDNPTLEIDQVLRIFEIEALQKLNSSLLRLSFK